MRVRAAGTVEVDELAGFAARLQERPDRHVCYLAEDQAAISQELAALGDWTAVSSVAEEDGNLIGWLVGEVNQEIGRVWWWGPFVDHDAWTRVADQLMDAAVSSLPRGIGQQELAVDSRFTTLTAWATDRGFEEEAGSVLLACSGELVPLPRDPAIRAFTSADAEAVAALHDELFPGNNYLGHQLVALDGPRRDLLVAEVEGQVVGYLATDQQIDGSGYIDLLGVAPSHRRRGIGAALLRSGGAALWRRGCRRLYLTVREESVSARALYAGLGFDEERCLVPLRLGFSLSGPAG